MAVGLSYLHIMLAFLLQHKPLVSVILFCEYGLIAVRIAVTANISVCGAVIVYNLLFLPFIHDLSFLISYEVYTLHYEISSFLLSSAHDMMTYAKPTPLSPSQS